MAIHHSKAEIVDGDGAILNGNSRDIALNDYYRSGEMYGAFFVNPETGEPGGWDYKPVIDWDGYADPKLDGVYVDTKAAREQAAIAAPRARKDPSLVRDINLIVKVTASEKAEIERRAEAAGYSVGKKGARLSVADFVRRTVLGDLETAGT